MIILRVCFNVLTFVEKAREDYLENNILGHFLSFYCCQFSPMKIEISIRSASL